MTFENGTCPIPLATLARERSTAFPGKLKVVIDADPQPNEKPLATATAKVGKATGERESGFRRR